eukprot:NODE_150_length_17275_cov_0.559618.p11 type:complete len:194 gc:universal NODE_150_length_17275_cov_0.559618:9745-9164(-)
MTIVEQIEYSLYGSFSGAEPPKLLWTTLDLYCTTSKQFKAYKVELANSLSLENEFNSKDWELLYLSPPEQVDGLTRRKRINSVVHGDISEIAHFFLPSVGSAVRTHRLHIGHMYSYKDTTIKVYNIVEPKDKFFYGEEFYQLYLDVIIEIIGDKDQVLYIQRLLKGTVDLHFVHDLKLRVIPDEVSTEEDMEA